MTPPGPLDRPERAHPAHEDTDPPPKPAASGPIPGVPARRLPSPPTVEPEPAFEPAERASRPRMSSNEIHRQEGTRRQSFPEIEPEPPTPSALLAWLKTWTPGSIATAAGVIVLALGGPSAVERILTSNKATTSAIEAAEERILKRIDERLKAHETNESAARDDITKAAQVERARLDSVANLACQLNDGPAGAEWPCDLKFSPPPAGNRAPLWNTQRRWPEPNP